MKINSTIIDKLNEYEIPVNEGMSYLIPLFFGYDNNYVPDEIKMQVLATDILSYDIESGTLTWNYHLFNSEINGKFEWVKTEFCSLFLKLNPKCPLMGEESIRRMIDLFKHNPDIRKDEIIGATKLYLSSIRDITYMGEPHYFIEKGRGVSKTQKILTWIEKYRQENTQEDSTHSSRTFA